MSAPKQPPAPDPEKGRPTTPPSPAPTTQKGEPPKKKKGLFRVLPIDPKNTLSFEDTADK